MPIKTTSIRINYDTLARPEWFMPAAGAGIPPGPGQQVHERRRAGVARPRDDVELGQGDRARREAPGALPLGDHRARGDQPSHLVRQERLVELTPAAQDRRWAVLTSSGLMLEQHGYREL
jgi:hypothetical protein